MLTESSTRIIMGWQKSYWMGDQGTNSYKAVVSGQWCFHFCVSCMKKVWRPFALTVFRHKWWGLFIGVKAAETPQQQRAAPVEHWSTKPAISTNKKHKKVHISLIIHSPTLFHLTLGFAIFLMPPPPPPQKKFKKFISPLSSFLSAQHMCMWWCSATISRWCNAEAV